MLLSPKSKHFVHVPKCAGFHSPGLRILTARSPSTDYADKPADPTSAMNRSGGLAQMAASRYEFLAGKKVAWLENDGISARWRITFARPHRARDLTLFLLADISAAWTLKFHDYLSTTS
jgi:hypothetical protein